ncbi:uncharacterized protein METZ01_LOCUS218192, partial [marine metagenome]
VAVTIKTVEALTKGPPTSQTDGPLSLSGCFLFSLRIPVDTAATTT